METPSPRKLIIPLLAIIAISLAAATLTSPTAVGGIGTGEENDPSEGLGSAANEPGGPGFSIAFDDESFIDFGSAAPLINIPCLEFLTDERFIIGTLIAVIIIGYVLYKQAGILAPLGVYIVTTPPAILIYRLLTQCSTVEPSRLVFAFTNGEAANVTSISLPLPGLGGADTAAGTAEPTSVFLFVILGLGLLIAIIVLYESTGDDIPSDPSSTQTTGSPWLPSTKPVETSHPFSPTHNSVIADNKIYQSWKKMTQEIDLPRPNATAPREYAEKAIEEGKHADAVQRLTHLFEEIRYGTTQPTPETEKQAVQALEQITDEENEDTDT